MQLFAVRDGATSIAIGALKQLGDGQGELKSKRTHPDHLRRGAAAALLDHLLAVAHEAGLRNLSLETGTAPSFQPAIALYKSRGFRPGPAFGDYPPSSEHNGYFQMDLRQRV